MGGGSYVQVPAINPGEMTDVSVTLKAPTQTGNYWGSWKLRWVRLMIGGWRSDVLHLWPRRCRLEGWVRFVGTLCRDSGRWSRPCAKCTVTLRGKRKESN